MAWRKDTRRQPNGSLYLLAAGAALGHPVSREWKGYWQRHLTQAKIYGAGAVGGAEALASCDARYEGPEEMAWVVFDAMTKVNPEA